MHKQNPIPLINNTYLPDKEYCFYVREKGGACYFDNNLPFRFYSSVKQTKCQASQFGHPTEKPIGMIKDLLSVSSRAGDFVLDPYMGSGTMPVACLELDRRFIGIEINQDFYEIAKKRIEAANNQTRLF
jgi:DNA modification methylase